MSARNRYVFVLGSSTTTSSSGTICVRRLPMGGSHEVRDPRVPIRVHPVGHLAADMGEDVDAAAEDRRPDLDRARTRHEVLDRVAAVLDPPDPEDRKVYRLPDLVYAPEADGLDRGAAEAPV